MDFDIQKLKGDHKTSFLATELERLLDLENNAKEMLSDESMKEMAEAELSDIEIQKSGIKEQIQNILDKEKEEEEFPNEIIMEIRAGAGGDEASLFALNLSEMYEKFSETKGWSFKKIHDSTNNVGGYKEASFEIKGQGVYKELMHETGVHRVQRIPATEKQGRIHTSTASVAIMPIKNKTSIVLDTAELDFEISRSGGPGGQNVNKVETAVRVIHKPTGLDVRSTSERTQLKNKEKAISILTAKLQQLKDEEEAKKSADHRKGQIGTMDRSEKIRTYNGPQDRVTDHRIKKSWSNIPGILNGDIGDIINELANAAEGEEKEIEE